MKKTALFAFLFSPLVWALTVTPEAVEKALSEATLVAEIETLEIVPVANSLLFAKSTAKVRILNVLHSQGENAPRPSDTIEIEFPGGELKENGSFFSGFPRLYRGKQYRASLKKISDTAWVVTGFEFGLVPLQQERAYSRNRTDGNNGEGKGAFLYWDNSYMPIPYHIAEPTFRKHAEFLNGIENSFKAWRDLENVRIELYPEGCSRTVFNENDGINNIILVTKDWPFDTSAIAITRNFYVAGTTDHAGLILDSDILLNGVDHQFTVSGEANKHDIQNIVTHEVGHFLGLGHEKTPQDSDATMYAVASTGETKKRTLATSDIAGITAAYPGTGEKLKNAGIRCQITEENTGCRLGVKNRPTRFPYGFLFALVFLFSQIALGRLFHNRR